MKRRKFLAAVGRTLVTVAGSTILMKKSIPESTPLAGDIILFLCGDVMTGRGIDQVMPHPSNPRIYEPYVRDARDYVRLAEKANGPILKPVSFPYIWGDALEELERVDPDLRIINLETSITTSEDYWKGKGINYRMHPENVACLTAAKIDCCTLANNHILDWGYSGLRETIHTLKTARIKTSGAGRNLDEALTPVVFSIRGKGRVIVFSFGSVTSGVPWTWAASKDKPGINLSEGYADNTLQKFVDHVRRLKSDGDIVVASIHWGSNWGHEISHEQRRFAHALIDKALVDIVHGHSSHHAKAVEIYRHKAILYGCGDFLNDYEGIAGYERFRSDLALMYVISMNPSTGRLTRFEMTPMQIRRFRLTRARGKDAQWLSDTLSRQGRKFGTWVKVKDNGRLSLQWPELTRDARGV